jgi:adiponectin receptor
MYFPGLFYMFHEYPALVAYIYVVMISIIALACASIGVAAAALGSSVLRKGLRIVAYTAMSASSLAPLSRIWVEQADDPVYRMTALRYVGCVAVAGYGALLYASGVPERFKPGMFDMVGNSHQIFHVSIVLCFAMFHASNAHLWVTLSSQEGGIGLNTIEPPVPTAVEATVLLQQ